MTRRPLTLTWPWLTSWRAANGRGHELAAIDHRVQAGLQQADHVLAGVAGAARGVLVVFAELPLGDVAVIALELLLGLKLGAIVGQLLGAALAVLARTIGALVDRALGAAPDILAHAAVDLVFGMWRACSSVSFVLGGRSKAAHYRHGLPQVKRPQPEVERQPSTLGKTMAYACIDRGYGTGAV